MGKPNLQERYNLSKSPDLSSFLSHLVRQNVKLSDDRGKSVLKSILNTQLNAGYSNWYAVQKGAKGYSIGKGRVVKAPKIKTVCFTEAPIEALRCHAEVFKAQYGLGFKRDFMESRGAAPTLNIPSTILYKHVARKEQVCHYVPEELQPFVNVISDSFDATIEREWRVIGNFNFSMDDIAVVYCPESEQEEFIEEFGFDRSVLVDIS